MIQPNDPRYEPGEALARALSERDQAQTTIDFMGAPDIEDVLGIDKEKWNKARCYMGDLVNKIIMIERAEFRSGAQGNYYIIHITDDNGTAFTTTTSIRAIVEKLVALNNRGALPVMARVVAVGEWFDFVSARPMTADRGRDGK
jgi:hypothetical protein